MQLNDVYMFMGRELEALDEIPAGNILGICELYCASTKCSIMRDDQNVLQLSVMYN